VAGAWSWPLTSNYCSGLENVDKHLTFLPLMVSNWISLKGQTSYVFECCFISIRTWPGSLFVFKQREVQVYMLSHVLVTVDGVRIDNWIYWSLTGRNYILISTLQITPY
jgi:hypothetical protein